MEDNLSRQKEEVEVVSAIYQENFKAEDASFQTYNIRIAEGDLIVNILVTLPFEYPSESPPYYLLNCPWMDRDDKEELYILLEKIAEENAGESILYLWAESIREYLQKKHDKMRIIEVLEAEEDESSRRKILQSPQDWSGECPNIISSEPFTEKKSTFQGHVASVVTQEQVRQVLSKLYENRKIAQATHNMYAYRIYKEGTKTWLQDCDDDGEAQAGGRLLHLLQIVDAKNVVVVVSRWFGGVLLGGDRFKLINNVARQVLELGGFVEQPIENGKKKNKK